ncbi:hypothetical protein HAX54_016441, partial [Datura stramonium]|nr:hypothetical protein [Datura stramonium]
DELHHRQVHLRNARCSGIGVRGFRPPFETCITGAPQVKNSKTPVLHRLKQCIPIFCYRLKLTWYRGLHLQAPCTAALLNALTTELFYLFSIQLL